MNKLIADKWVKALRSDEYPQGFEKLQSPEGLCCLGVLCEIAKLENIHVKLLTSGAIDGVNLHLQYGVKEWSGIKSHNCKLDNTVDVVIHNSLAYLNDSGNYNFNQIADVIENHWDEL